MSQTPLERAIEKLTPHGYHIIETNVGTMLGNIGSSQTKVNGVCSLIPSQQAFINTIKWASGALVMIRDESPLYIIMEHFYMLESPDIPRSLLSLRDYVDYGLESKIKESFPLVHPMIGPQWNYLYGAENLEQQLEGNSLLLLSPLVGNNINSRSDDLDILLPTHFKIKELIASECPIPTLYGFPEEITLGLKDCVYDLPERKWYSLNVHAPFSDNISIVEFAQRAVNPGVQLTFAQHRYEESKIVDAPVDLASIEVEVQQINGEFRRRWRLPDLALAFA